MSFCKYFSYLNIFISSFLSFFSTNSCKTFLRIVIGHIDLGWVFILIRSVKPIFTLNLKKKWSNVSFHFDRCRLFFVSEYLYLICCPNRRSCCGFFCHSFPLGIVPASLCRLASHFQRLTDCLYCWQSVNCWWDIVYARVLKYQSFLSRTLSFQPWVCDHLVESREILVSPHFLIYLQRTLWWLSLSLWLRLE